MTIDRKWTMPCRHTFKIPQVKTLLLACMEPCTSWVDPFAGRMSPAKVTNDLDKDANAEFHMDALEFLHTRKNNEFDGILYDPPYSFRQASECYKGNGREAFTGEVTRMDYWSKCKDEAARIVRTGGRAICFGWNSNGLGKGRGFELERILLLAHGGSQNDTIITVEVKR